MPKGVYPRKRKQAFVQARPRYQYANQGNNQGASRLSVEPTVPTVHLERGSGGELRYGVRTYGLTLAQAREEVLREFLVLQAAVEDIKAKIPGLK